MSVTPASELGDFVTRPTALVTADTLAANATRANLRRGTDAQDAAGDPHLITDDVCSECEDSDDADVDDTNEGGEQSDARIFADGQLDRQRHFGSDFQDDESLELPSLTPSPGGSDDGPPYEDEDVITDTVGAIAIDNEGNIACGASSGGIGMKFRGRVGPAALVGVGAAVCPVNAEDKSRMCTGAVTSGTGEHMGTTLAANVCAERLYNSVRSRRSGGLEPCSDDEAVKAMIEQDFMSAYKGLDLSILLLNIRRSSQCSQQPFCWSHWCASRQKACFRRLPVLCTQHRFICWLRLPITFSIWLITLQALASMHADETKPSCTMSRSHGNGMIAQGGRAIRYKRKW